VNQTRGVAGTLASHHGEGFGLEAGSKPELMAVLALSRPGRADRLQRSTRPAAWPAPWPATTARASAWKRAASPS
ncbi:hypothetical protein C7E18_23525, partial [Stenotrophomonas maltophilia]